LLLIRLFIYDYISMSHIHKVTLIASGCIIGVHIVIIMLWGLLT
jgi:hypothetical protein